MFSSSMIRSQSFSSLCLCTMSYGFSDCFSLLGGTELLVWANIGYFLFPPGKLELTGVG